MNKDLKKILCEDCKTKVNAHYKMLKARKRLVKNPQASFAQKQHWKKVIAKGMRINPTQHEEIMRHSLLMVGYQFREQEQIGPYIVDFLILPKLVIEVDGLVHTKRVEYDKARDRFLESRGYTVLRFTNESIFEGFPDCPYLDVIYGVQAPPQ